MEGFGDGGDDMGGLDFSEGFEASGEDFVVDSIPSPVPAAELKPVHREIFYAGDAVGQPEPRPVDELQALREQAIAAGASYEEFSRMWEIRMEVLRISVAPLLAKLARFHPDRKLLDRYMERVFKYQGEHGVGAFLASIEASIERARKKRRPLPTALGEAEFDQALHASLPTADLITDILVRLSHFSPRRDLLEAYMARAHQYDPSHGVLAFLEVALEYAEDRGCAALGEEDFRAILHRWLPSVREEMTVGPTLDDVDFYALEDSTEGVSARVKSYLRTALGEIAQA